MYRMLCVFAHPDDECYGPGGAIAQCVLDGGRVFLTTFTAGEAGSIGKSRELGNEELARRRRAELAAACAALGVEEHRILGAPDGRVATVDGQWAVAEIAADVARFEPHVVVSFHYRGVSGHPDHIAVTGFLDRAFVDAGESGPHRYYQWGISRAHASLYNRPNLVPIEEDEIDARIEVTGAAMDRKIAAIEAHATQYPFFAGLTEQYDYRKIGTPEPFALRRWRGEKPRGVTQSLFEGIEHA